MFAHHKQHRPSIRPKKLIKVAQLFPFSILNSSCFGEIRERKNKRIKESIVFSSCIVSRLLMSLSLARSGSDSTLSWWELRIEALKLHLTRDETIFHLAALGRGNEKEREGEGARQRERDPKSHSGKQTKWP